MTNNGFLFFNSTKRTNRMSFHIFFDFFSQDNQNRQRFLNQSHRIHKKAMLLLAYYLAYLFSITEASKFIW